MGIEPTSEAWEASILPLYDARSFLRRFHYNQHTVCSPTWIFQNLLDWKAIPFPFGFAGELPVSSFCDTIYAWEFCGGFHAGWDHRTR